MPPVSRWSTERRVRATVLQVVVLVAAALCGHVATAAPPKSAVQAALVKGAQKEFDAGNFDRAGELFLEIWRQDNRQVVALYNAARSHHLAGKFEKAEDLYRALLAPGLLDAAAAGKVRGFLEELRPRRAEAKADEATRAEKASNYALAGQLWSDAARMMPEKPVWLLRSARAEHLAGHADAAARGYDGYLAVAPQDAAERGDAQRWRAELRPGAATAPAIGRQTPALPAPSVHEVGPQAPSVRATSAPARPLAGHATLGAGVLGVVAGGVLLGLAAADESTLQAKVAQTDGKGNVTGVAYGDAEQQATAIESRYRIGWAITGVGAVAAGVGTWLVLRHGDRVSVAPGQGGAVVAVRF